jgi:hypothetical protein
MVVLAARPSVKAPQNYPAALHRPRTLGRLSTNASQGPSPAPWTDPASQSLFPTHRPNDGAAIPLCDHSGRPIARTLGGPRIGKPMIPLEHHSEPDLSILGRIRRSGSIRRVQETAAGREPSRRGRQSPWEPDRQCLQGFRPRECLRPPALKSSFFHDSLG